MFLSHPKPPPDHYYQAPLRPPHRHENDENYVVLPSYHPPNPQKRRTTVSLSILLLLLLLLVYILWPSDPAVKVVRLRVNKIHFHTFPILCVDLGLNLTLKVRNVDVYSLEFTTLDVDVGYRGKRLGHVSSGGGHVRAMASSYVDAEVELRVEVVSELVYLFEDLAGGTVPFDTVAEVAGKLGLLFFGFPLKAKMSCEILVNTKNKTISRRNCHPER